jgi:hypothetical protein
MLILFLVVLDKSLYLALCGFAGGGKSVTAKFALAHVLPRILPPELIEAYHRDPDKFVHYRKIANTYFEGWTRLVRACVYDDLGCHNDENAAGGASEFEEIIYGVNSDPHPLNMAFEGKGTMFNNSLFYVSTSNQLTFNFNSITNGAAFYRRQNFVYITYPKPEYCQERKCDKTGYDALMDKKLDISKLPEGLHAKDLSPEHLLFQRVFIDERDFSVNMLGGPETFDIVMDKVVAQIKINEAIFKQMSMKLDEKRKEYVVPNIEMISVPQAKMDIRSLKQKLESVGEEIDPDYAIEADTVDGEIYRFVNQLFKNAHEEREVFDGFFIRTMGDIVRRNNSFDWYDQNIPNKLCLRMMIRRFGNKIIEMYDAKDVQEIEKFRRLFNMQYDQFGYEHFPSVRLSDKTTNLYRSVRKWWIETKEEFTLENLKSGWDRIYNAFTSAMEYMPLLRIFFTGFAFIAGMIAADKMFGEKPSKEDQEYKNSKKSLISPESFHFTGKVRSRPRKLKEIKALRAKNKPQMCITADRTSDNIMNKVLRRNLWAFHYEKTPGKADYERMGYCLFIKGTICVIPYHYVTLMQARVDVDAKNDEAKIKLTLDQGPGQCIEQFCFVDQFIENSYEVEKLDDIALFKFPGATGDFGCRPTILQYIPTLEDHKKTVEFPFKLVNSYNCHTVIAHGNAERLSVPELIEHETGNYLLATGYYYDVCSEEGDCGSMFMIINPRSGAAKIFGIHVAGNSAIERGFSSALVREILEEEIAEIDTSDMLTEELEDATVPQANCIISNGQVLPLYELSKPVPVSYDTQIIKSRLYGKLGPSIYEVAITRPINNVDPWEKALGKYCVRRGIISVDIAQDVGDCLYDDLLRTSKISVAKIILTPKESALGTDDPDMVSLPRMKAIGYPGIMTHVPGYPKRTRYLGLDPLGYEFTSRHWIEGLEFLNNIVEDAKVLKRYNEWLIIDNMKDETLPIEKVIELKARIFCALAFLKLLLDKQYFGQFCLWLQKNRIENGIATGVNVYSTEWHLIAKKLEMFGRHLLNIGAGDYSGYDGSQRGQIHKILLELINRWYDDGPENANIRRTLFAEVYNSKHIRGKLVYEWFGGMTSGFYMTTALNCLYGLYALRYVWYAIHDFKKACLTRFLDNVYAIVQGDDNAFAVHPDYVHKFNEVSISHHLKDLGLVYTNETKSGVNTELRYLRDIEFLKRSFVWDPLSGTYVGPLRLNALLEIINWTKKGDKRKEITLQNVDTTIKELAIHGKVIFNEYVPKIAKALYDEYKCHPFTTSFGIAHNTVFESSHLL